MICGWGRSSMASSGPLITARHGLLHRRRIRRLILRVESGTAMCTQLHSIEKETCSLVPKAGFGNPPALAAAFTGPTLKGIRRLRMELRWHAMQMACSISATGMRVEIQLRSIAQRMTEAHGRLATAGCRN